MKSLNYTLLLISLLFSCQQQDSKTEKKQEQAEVVLTLPYTKDGNR
jgi:hypothetical protein